jgi:hypothetical protein
MSVADSAVASLSKSENISLDGLRQLAVKGAYAKPAADHGSSDFAVFSPRNKYCEAIRIIPRPAFVSACRRGWLKLDGQSGRYRIAPPGIDVLRRIKSGAAAARSRTSSAGSVSGKKAQQSARVAVPAEGSLGWLRRRRDRDGQPLISEAQFSAGERLGADFWHSQLRARVTADWSGTAPSRRMARAAPGVGIEISDRVIAARQRVHRALAAVGPELAPILVEVCCYDVGLETAGRTQGWPQRSAKVVLQLALTGLARHYGLIAPQAPIGRLRHWASEDYRPNLEGW